MTTYQTQALQTLSRRFQGVLLGFLGYRAGKNHFDLTGELDTAIITGATALRRWWVWLFFTKLWLLWLGVTGWMVYMQTHDIRGESFQDHTGIMKPWTTSSLILLLPVLVLGVLVPYCRNVDYSLFKRRFVYKMFRPLTRLFDWAPVGFMYLTVLVGLFMPVGWFTGTDTPREFVTEVPAEDMQDFPQNGEDVCEDNANGTDGVGIPDLLGAKLGIDSRESFEAWIAANC